MNDGKVPPVRIRTKDEVSDALASDWLPLAPHGKRAAFSINIGGDKDGKVVSKAISGEHLPEAHTIFNSLVANPAALFNTFRLFGGVFTPVGEGACDDMETISAMLRAATEYLDRMKDGVRDHRDTAALATLFKPLIPAMLCVMREAAEGKGATLRAVAA